MSMLGNIKEIMQARSQAKRIQNEIQKITAEYSNGGISAVARGDGVLVSLSVAEGGYDEVKAGKPQRFETMLANVVNGALKKARESAQIALQKSLGGSGLDGLFG